MNVQDLSSYLLYGSLQNYKTYIVKDGENLEVCDFGYLDGLHTIPFLKKGYLVDAFDMNEIYLYGGHIQMLIIYEDGQVVLQRRTM